MFNYLIDPSSPHEFLYQLFILLRIAVSSEITLSFQNRKSKAIGENTKLIGSSEHN